MAYDLVGFINDNPPAINQTNLNHMDQGIKDAHTQLAVVDGNIDHLENDLYVLEDISLIQGAFINLGGGVGSTVSLTPTSNAGYAYVIVNCKAGDTFYLSAKGGTNSRAYGFLNTSNKLLSVADAGVYISNQKIMATQDGKLVVNAYLYDTTTYPYFLKKYVSALEKTIAIKLEGWIVDYDIVDGNASIGDTIDLTPVAFPSYSCMVIPCEAGDKFRLTGRGGQGARLWAFVDTNNKLLSISAGGITVSDLEISAVYDGKLIVNSYNLIPYSIYKYVKQDVWMDEINDLLDSKPWNDRVLEFVMPSKCRVCEDIEMNFYFNNFIRYVDSRKVQLMNMSNAKISNYTTFGRYTGVADSADFTTKAQIYSNDTDKAFMVSNDLTIHTVNKSAGSGVTKKVLLIGDSLTDADASSGELVTMFGNDVMNLELIGTLGTAPNVNEGRAGWRAYTYCYCAQGSDDHSGLSYTNPFFNPSSNKFDFHYYMTQNGFSGVDYVFICLGTNDIGRSDHSTDADIISYYDLMINSIKAYNPNIIIGLWLPPTRALYANTNRKGIDGALRAHKLLIQTYGNQESNKIYLVPVYFNVDPEHDYAYQEVPISSRNQAFTMMIASDIVHPAVVGYKKIADVLFSYIKFFASIQ